MSIDTEQIFVYGTLRPSRPDTLADDSRYYSQIAAFVETAIPARLAGAELYDMGTYPAVVPGQGLVQGDLLRVKSAAMAITDRIEGHPTFYRRDRVTVQTENGSAKAWIYWAPKGLTIGRRRVPCGDWFQRRHGGCQEEASSAAEASSNNTVDTTLKALVRRFAEAECSWLSSTRPDGRAHSAPVWHVWHQGRVYVMTTSEAVKTANIAQHLGVVIAHPDPHHPVIIEGWATFAPATRTQLRPLFKTKYDWDIAYSSAYDTIIEITPTKLLAWGKHGEGRWSGVEVLQVRIIDED